MNQLPSKPTPAELERLNRDLFILHQMAEALNREVNLTETLQTALAKMAELFDLHTGWIFCSATKPLIFIV